MFVICYIMLCCYCMEVKVFFVVTVWWTRVFTVFEHLLLLVGSSFDVLLLICGEFFSLRNGLSLYLPRLPMPIPDTRC